MNIDGSSFLPSIDSFQIHVPLASTPKRNPNKFHNFLQPLSSTLSNDSYKQFELSISAITLVSKSSSKQRRRSYQIRSNRRRYRPRTHIHSSTIIKRIELKYLLYSTRAMKRQQNKQRIYTESEMKIYVL